MQDILKMLPVTISPESLNSDDPDVQEALITIASKIKYSNKLYESLERAYDWQKRVVEMTMDSRVIGAICGNQMGKSEIVCAIVTCHLTGIYPLWWKGKKFNKPVKIMAAGVDSNHNKNVLQERLFGTNNKRLKKEIGSGMIPKDAIINEALVSVRGDDIASAKILHSTGGMSELIFRAYSQGREAAQGFVADVIMIDEQPNDDFWSEALVRTATTGGHVLCSFTPLKGKTSLIEELLGLKETADSPKDKFGYKYKSEAGWSMVRASWDDMDHITDVDKQQLIKGFAAYEVDARTFGMPIAGHGRVIPYTYDEMVYDPKETKIPILLPHLISIDIGHGHGRDPSAVTLLAWDKENDIIYVKEQWVGPTNTTRELARKITGINHTVPVAWPSDANRSGMNSPETVADQLRDLQVNLLGKPFLNPRGADGKRNNFKAPGIHEINNRFAEGRLMISTDCVELLNQIENYQYTESGKLQDGKDDAIDSLRYGVQSIIQDHGEPIEAKHVRRIKDDEEDYYYNTY